MKDGRIHWSQPEILLYDDDPKTRMSYPDLIEQDGKYWVSETQKRICRVHPVDAALIEGLWTQGEVKEVTRRGLVREWRLSSRRSAGVPTRSNLSRAGASPLAQAPTASSAAAGEDTRAPAHARSLEVSECGTITMPQLPDLTTRGGLTLDLWVRFDSLANGQILADTRLPSGKGLLLGRTPHGSVQVALSDGTHASSWDCDPVLLTTNRAHHLGIVVDGGPRIITFVVDDQVCDGGSARQHGWSRVPLELADVNGAKAVEFAPSLQGDLLSLRIYQRCLRHSELIANCHAGSPPVQRAEFSPLRRPAGKDAE